MSFDLAQELKNSKDYRDAFVNAHISNGIAFQLRALRDSKEWDQKDVARELGKPSAQPMISRYENPDYGKYSVATLLEFAHLYDVALVVRFATFSELLRHDHESRQKSFYISSFKEEVKAGFISPHSYISDRIGTVVATQDHIIPKLFAKSEPYSYHEAATFTNGLVAVQNGATSTPGMAA